MNGTKAGMELRKSGHGTVWMPSTSPTRPHYIPPDHSAI